MDRATFFGLLALILLTAIPYGTVEEWWEALFQCVVLALAAMWVFESALSGKWSVREHRLLMPLLALLVFLFLQTIPFSKENFQGVEVWRALSADPFETRLIAFRFLTLIVFAALLLRFTSTPRRLGGLIHVVVSTGVASALFGIVRQATQGEGTGFLLPYLESGRGYGQFINYNHFAFLMEMTLGLLAGLIIAGGIHRYRLRLIIYAASLVLVWTALVFSNSRGGIFAMLGQVCFLPLLFSAVKAGHLHQKQRDPVPGKLQRIGRALVVRVTLIALLIMVMVLALAWVGGEPLARRMERVSDEVSEEKFDERAGMRLNFWTATWKLFRANQVGGTGFGSYWIAIDPHYDASGNSTPQQAHNDYLEFLAAGGVIGIAFAAWFVVAFIRRARTVLHSRSSFRRAACFGALGGIIAIAIHSAVDFGLHATANALVFTSLVVIATVRVEEGQYGAQTGIGHKIGSLPPPPLHRLSRASSPRRFGRLAVITACVVCIWAAACVGLSRRYSDSAAKDRQLAQANRAIQLTPSDPVAHFVRAGVLMQGKQLAAALEEYERAIALRPGDHVLWLNLGFVREQSGDAKGALAAFGEAVRLAPHYAMPRWQLGRFLLQTGQRELAFAELSRAAASDPELLTPAADLIWKECGGDARRVRQVINPETNSAKLALARYFDKRGVLKETLELFRQAGSAAAPERLALLTRLLKEKKFLEAYEVWSSGRGNIRATEREGIDIITDNGFEGDIDLSEQGFGWRQVASSLNAMRVSLDANEPRAGSRSLRIDFSGSPSAENTISQVVLVEASTRYRLSFAARARSLITGGLPVITVTDMSNAGKLFGQSVPLTSDRKGWQEYSIGFTTTGATSAVMIEIRRQPCATKVCPIFGSVWLDNFSLQKL